MNLDGKNQNTTHSVGDKDVTYSRAIPVVASARSPAEFRDIFGLPIARKGIAGDGSRFLTSMERLQAEDYPFGLIEELLQEKDRCPLRFWLIDNSGSMLTCDGHLFDGSTDKKIITSTRWSELQATVQYHIEMAGILRAASVFILVNDPVDVRVPNKFSVAARSCARIPEEVNAAKHILQITQPQGSSPITAGLNKIHDRILKHAEALRAAGKKAVIILITDGLPNESEAQFLDALESMKGLPVWVVVRLCTDDKAVRNFYNELDRQLDLPLEVVSSFDVESKEVAKHNPWLNYALPLHRAREIGGCQCRVLDLLDEKKLNREEFRDFLILLYGRSRMEGLPDVQSDWKNFLKAITPIIQGESSAWNPRTKRSEPWIDTRRLEKAYGSGFWRVISGASKQDH